MLSPASPQRMESALALAEAYRAAGRADDARRALADARAVLAAGGTLGPQYTQALQRSARVVAGR